MAAQFCLLPLAGVGGHVHRHLKADAGAHDANGHPEVAGRPHGDAVLAEEVLKAGLQQDTVIVVEAEQPGGQGQFFRVGQHFIDPAAGFNRAGDRQMAIFFQQQGAGDCDV
ncbi:hypothetical protein D3C76_1506150 [compost metagenome]